MNSIVRKSFPFSVLITLTFLTLSFQLNAATYKGRVIDAETGHGQGGVLIKLQNSTGQTVSDSTGAFSLTASLGVKPRNTGTKGGPILRYLPGRGGFYLSPVENPQSLHVYSLQGRCITTVNCTPSTNFVRLNMPTHGLYFLCLRTTQHAYTFIWNHNGTSRIIAPKSMPAAQVHQLAKAAAGPALIFEKNGYQQEQMQIEAVQDYDNLLIKMKPLIGDYIFDDDTVRTYRLYLSESEIKRLLDFNALVSGFTVNKVWATGRLVFEDRSLDSISVRFRGDQSIWDCISGGERKKDVHYPQYGFGNGDVCAKFSMKFDFNRINRDQRLYGLKALNFRSMSFDPTKMHERLGFSLYRDMEVNAPRAVHARLYVNDSLWGLFCVAEEIDGRFLKSRYPLTGNGNLYKEAWPEEAASESFLLSALETNNNPEDNPNVSDFMAFRDSVINESTDSVNFLSKISKLVDIHHLIRYIVVDRCIGNFDGIVSAYAFGGGAHMRHNYFWYHNEETGLFELIPWDLDKALLFPEPNFWSNNQPTGSNQIPNWNVINSDYTPIFCDFDPGSFGGYYVEPIDTDKFLRLVRTTTWKQFTAQCRHFLDNFFTSAKVDERIDKWHKQIAQPVGNDPTIDSTEWNLMVDSLKKAIPLMRTNLELMSDTLIVR